jgi:hypothetical protein
MHKTDKKIYGDREGEWMDRVRESDSSIGREREREREDKENNG